MPGHSTEPFAGFVESQHSAWINQPEGLTKVSGMSCSALSLVSAAPSQAQTRCSGSHPLTLARCCPI
ncbi:hypothetical protein J7394_05685 [Ruegeria sp. R13_0]|uniref:hypothetical protein n=1 Tax=Ruegeria sp. R13_0 TaxID=2821099 RepID=UPI001ADB6868|nr:hypothetical protein [Ruegeria sp. R13_0]MBO9433686.1 hypothetical protein [Ruegeria sp. R13_0]